MSSRGRPILAVDLCSDAGTRGCRRCPDRTECDQCSRDLCYLLHIEVHDEALCPECARDLGATDDDITEGRFSLGGS